MDHNPELPPETVEGEDIYRNPVLLNVDALRWRPGVYAIIVNENDELLVLDNQLNGELEIPGGGVELWERIPEALEREIWEETGLMVRMGIIVGAEDDFYLSPSGNALHTVAIVCTAIVLGGTLRETIIDDEMTLNPHWIPLEDLDYSRFGKLRMTLRNYLE